MEKDDFCKSVKRTFCDGLWCSDCKKVQAATKEFLKNAPLEIVEAKPEQHTTAPCQNGTAGKPQVGECTTSA